MYEKLNTYSMIKLFIKDVFPLVDSELGRWKNIAMNCPDNMLYAQAVSSICKKSFHARGGSFFSIYPGVDNYSSMVKLIVAYQTISDYLDNLCDRSGVQDEAAFSQLHLAMTDALDPAACTHDYYMYYPYSEDGGYLLSLVNECKMRISCLPSYYIVKEEAMGFARLYSSLQAYKHISPDIREKRLFTWANAHIGEFPGILSHEFCAAAGSTLGIFMLFALSSVHGLSIDQVYKIKKAYFPWVCGLHILLDYFIDMGEDTVNSDLNFVCYYNDYDEMLVRLRTFVSNSLSQVSHLECREFHNTMVLGLLSMYLSDSKAFEDDTCSITRKLLSCCGARLKIMHWLCTRLRKKGII